MDKSEALRAIHHDQLEYIQKNVAVDFDNTRQMPLTFHYRGRRYAVEEIVCSCRTNLDHATAGYLVQVQGDESIYL